MRFLWATCLQRPRTGFCLLTLCHSEKWCRQPKAVRDTELPMLQPKGFVGFVSLPCFSFQVAISRANLKWLRPFHEKDTAVWRDTNPLTWPWCHWGCCLCHHHGDIWVLHSVGSFLCAGLEKVRNWRFLCHPRQSANEIGYCFVWACSRGLEWDAGISLICTAI